MTNGGFITAKLAMAFATTVLTWLIVFTAASFWLATVGKGIFASNMHHSVSPNNLVEFILACSPLVILIGLWTWSNLTSGITAGLTGRAWVIAIFVLWRALVYVGLVSLVVFSAKHADFRIQLLSWMPSILSSVLVFKLLVSAASFAWSLRRNAITPRIIWVMLGIWLAGGLLIAAFAAVVCAATNRQDMWSLLVLTGFLVMPLMEFSLAPIAMAWNRHR